MTILQFSNLTEVQKKKDLVLNNGIKIKISIKIHGSKEDSFSLNSYKLFSVSLCKWLSGILRTSGKPFSAGAVES